MVGRRSIVGLSLLCALLFSAFAAQSASAAASTNTTAFTCVSSPGGTTNRDFSDAHCDKAVAPGTGSFEHLLIPAGTTELDTSNAKVQNNTTEADSHILNGEPFKLPVEITCKTVVGTGTLANTEPAAGEHVITGTATLNYSNCNVKKVINCTAVHEPIVAKATVQALDKLGLGANEMGVEYKAEAGKPLATIELKGTCAIATKPFNLEGAVVATSGSGSQTTKHSGATSEFTKAMTKETLTAGGKKAEYEGKLTTTMKSGGNPIAFTTTT